MTVLRSECNYTTRSNVSSVSVSKLMITEVQDVDLLPGLTCSSIWLHRHNMEVVVLSIMVMVDYDGSSKVEKKKVGIDVALLAT